MIGTVAFSGVIAWRLDSVIDSVDALMAGEWMEISDHSLKTRLFMWQAAVDAIREKPWLGWGPNGVQDAMVALGEPLVRKYPHFHNIVLNLWVALGTVGMIFVATCVVMAIRLARRMLKTEAVPRHLVVLAASGLLAFAVLSQLQIRYNDPVGVVPNALFLGLLIGGSLMMRARRETAESA